MSYRDNVVIERVELEFSYCIVIYNELGVIQVGPNARVFSLIRFSFSLFIAMYVMNRLRKHQNR